MRISVINHGSRHRPSRGRRKYGEARSAGENLTVHVQATELDREWEDWSNSEDDYYNEFEDDDHFGLHRQDSGADLLGGLLSGAELQRLIDPSLWDSLDSLPATETDHLGEQIDEEWAALPSDELIESLHARCEELRAAKDWQDCMTVPDDDLQVLRSFWRDSDGRLTGATAPLGYCLPFQLGLVALLEPFWLRPAASWRRPDGDDRVQFGSLLNHLFMRYPVPQFLLHGVDWVADRNNWKWLLWVVLIGGGASMVRAGRRLGWWVNSALLEQLTIAPGHLDAISACIWAEVQRHGGSAELADTLANHPGFRLDPTEVNMPTPPSAGSLSKLAPIPSWRFTLDARECAERDRSRRFWQATLEWLIKYESRLPMNRIRAILTWANHQFIEDQHDLFLNLSARLSQGTGRPFSWKGRTPAAALRAADEYQLRLRRRQGPNREWDAKGWDWQMGVEANTTWSMHELTCSDELFEEGKAMHHCVAGYDLGCVAGQSAIFSLCANGARVLTIEIDPATLQIRQVYGECNRRAAAEELAIINRWKIECARASRA